MNNSIIKFNLTNLKQIVWPVVLFYFIRVFNILTEKQVFLVYMVLLGGIIFYIGKIYIPKIPGLWIYLFFILYSSILGIFINTTRNVARDLYYVMPSVVVIVLGYYLSVIYSDKLSLKKTLVFSSTIVSTIVTIRMVLDPSIMSDFADIRTNFNMCVYEVLMCFLVLFTCLLTKERLFNKWFEYYSLFIMCVHLLLSLARSAWVELGLGVLIIVILDGYRQRSYQKSIVNILKAITIIIMGVVVFFYIAPDSVITELMEKFAKSQTEISTDNEYNTVEDAMENWRGYEIKMAQEQWKNAPLVIELIGEGMGKGIKLGLIPFTWKDMVEKQHIPLLHNAYYTILPKGGVLGLFSFLCFMFAPIIYCLRAMKNKKYAREKMIIISISVIFIIQAYIVRGPVSQEVNIAWCMALGWMFAEIEEVKANKKTIKYRRIESYGTN